MGRIAQLLGLGSPRIGAPAKRMTGHALVPRSTRSEFLASVEEILTRHVVETHVRNIVHHWSGWTAEPVAQRLQPLLDQVVRFWGPLPASPGNHHSYAYGGIEHTLQVMALMLCSANALLGRPNINQQAADRALAVLLLGAAHDMGKLITDMRVTPGNGESTSVWNPARQSLYEWRQQVGCQFVIWESRPHRDGEHQKHIEYMANLLMFKTGIELCETEHDLLTDAIRSPSSRLFQMMKNKDSHSAGQAITQDDPNTGEQAPLLRAVSTAIRSMVETRRWLINAPGNRCRLYHAPQGLIMVHRRGLEEVTAYLKKEYRGHQFISLRDDLLLQDLIAARAVATFSLDGQTSAEVQFCPRGLELDNHLRGILFPKPGELHLDLPSQPQELASLTDSFGRPIGAQPQELSSAAGTETPSSESDSPASQEESPQSAPIDLRAASSRLTFKPPSDQELLAAPNHWDDLEDGDNKYFLEALVGLLRDEAEIPLDVSAERLVVYFPQTFEMLGVNQPTAYRKQLDEAGWLEHDPKTLKATFVVEGVAMLVLKPNISAFVAAMIEQTDRRALAAEGTTDAPGQSVPAPLSPQPPKSKTKKKAKKKKKARRTQPAQDNQLDLIGLSFAGVSNDPVAAHILDFLATEYGGGKLPEALMQDPDPHQDHAHIGLTPGALAHYVQSSQAKVAAEPIARKMLLKSGLVKEADGALQLSAPASELFRSIAEASP